MKTKLLATHLAAIGFAVFACPNLAYSQLESGLRNYWQFDNDLEDSTSDFTGTASTVEDDGTFAGANGIDGIAFGAGLFGGAGIEQNGAGGGAGGKENDGYVLVARSADTLYGATSTVSTSLWVRTAGVDSSWQTMLSHGEGSQYRIARRGGSNPPIASYAGGSGDIPGNDTTGPQIGVDNGWHHVVAISEGGASTRLWVDGGLVATGGAPTINDNGNGNPASPNLFIGANPQTGANNREWWGEIDDVAQWDRVLTASEVGAIHDAGLAGNALSTLLPSMSGEDNDAGVGDGMDDGWEATNGLDPDDPTDAAEDPDMDNLTNLQEWNGGDNPTNPQKADSDGDGLNDDVERLGGITDPNNPDSDDDGLNDGDEIAANTLPNDPDTDDDGMGDGYEVDSGHDPLVNDAADDKDDDGSSNLEECQRGTDPNVQDTDMDGLFDGVEDGGGSFVNPMMTGTDPLNPDTDGDFLLDGAEVTIGTNPHVRDTDGDDVIDGKEVDVFGTDPLLPDSGNGFGLLAYWPMDNDFNDTVGAHHGTEDGEIAFETGKFGNAGNFNGTQSVVITGGGAEDFTLAGQSMSVSVWCTATVIDKSWQCIVGKGEGNSWRLHRRGDAAVTPTQMSWTGGNGDIDAHATPFMIGTDPETWHHWLAVVDSKTQTELLYQDGALIASKTGAVLVRNSGNRMRIADNPDANGRQWNGKIDDLAIWCRALTADDATAIYNAGLGTSIEEFIGGGSPFRMTEITYDEINDEFTLAWTSKPGRTYALFWSGDAVDWGADVNDSIESGGDTTTFGPFPNPDPGAKQILFRAEEVR